jgi:GNAT superfamily N-acetyltransferase
VASQGSADDVRRRRNGQSTSAKSTPATSVGGTINEGSRRTQVRYELSQKWWLEAFYEPFGLTPEGMADLITKSAPGEKSSAYHYIDASREAFSLRVDGDFPGTREFWYAYRELDLKGGAFNAEGLEISPGMHGEGYGRAIMGDLIDASRLMGIERIKLRAEDIGIYVWLKMGFLPTSEAWREMRREAFDFILLHRPLLEKDRDVTALLTQVMAGGPSMARVLNLIDTEVPSRKIPSRFARKMMPFGKVFFLEAASPWNGVLDLRDAETVKAVESYRARE